MTARTNMPMDAQRALTIAAYSALIDQQLGQHRDRVADSNRIWLIERFVAAGVATVTHRAGADCLNLLGIAATSSGSAYALLRNWQIAAKARLAEGSV